MAKVRPKKKARAVRAKMHADRKAKASRPSEPEQIVYTFMEHGTWVAGFVPFDLMAQGSTEAEARQRLDSSIAATILWDIEDGVEPLSRVKPTPKEIVEQWARKHRETRTLAPQIDPVRAAQLLAALASETNESLEVAVRRVVGERNGLIAERDRLHTKCSDLVKQQDDWDNKLRGIMDASQFEQVDAAATRLVEEVQAWRSGCETAFGGHTANPHKTLVEIAKAQRDYREKHYDLERLLVTAAKDALRRLPDKEHEATCTSLVQNHPCDCGLVDAMTLKEHVEAMQAQHEGEVS